MLSGGVEPADGVGRAWDRGVGQPHHAVEIEDPIHVCKDGAIPRFASFPGIRYATDDLSSVTAPPYDVIDDDERAELVAKHPHNVVRIDLPRGDDAYAEAARLFQQWQDEGVLVVDEPSLYLYRMDGHTLGVIGALGLEPPGQGDVLPHEHTTPKARSDRLDLLRTTHANLSPVWGLSLASGLSKLLDPSTATALGSWRDGDGIAHELWRVSDADTIARIVESVSSAPVVIADGHHRYETCLAFAAEQPDLAGASSTLCFVVELAPDQLTVQPIHRLIRNVSLPDLEAALASEYELDAGDVSGLALVTPQGTRPLRRLDDGKEIDSVVLHRALDRLPEAEVSFQHGVDNVERAVRSGAADAAVLLRGVTVDQITAYANARDKMPPKSTFFYPKLRTGTVFRSLD
ncbi:MAG TPA: DUF1015 domain-containing protein [Acidimicrobiales bacterium]|nr:DUF1015 domain-containing protein [Acidimicrobiales bacterium]